MIIYLADYVAHRFRTKYPFLGKLTRKLPPNMDEPSKGAISNARRAAGFFVWPQMVFPIPKRQRQDSTTQYNINYNPDLIKTIFKIKRVYLMKFVNFWFTASQQNTASQLKISQLAPDSPNTYIAWRRSQHHLTLRLSTYK